MSWKDQTFCHDWCATTSCHRNYAHIQEAQLANLIPEWMPVCYFVNVPVDCKEWTPNEPEPQAA